MSASLPIQEFKEFDKDWFVKIFNEYPLLLRFATKGIQTSTDGTDPTKAKNLTSWHKGMYAALAEKFSFEEGLRYHELERTMLSLIVFSVMRQKEYDSVLFFKEYKSNLDAKDISAINELYIGNEKEMNLAMIMGDLGKIDEVKQHFFQYGLETDDQDLALEYILNLPSTLLESFFKITAAQVMHLKKNVFPLHLGHAVQGECTPKKFKEAQKFLLALPEIEREKIIRYAIFKQLLDVAGARAQNGAILLNKVILENYLTLMDCLLKLAKQDSEPVQLYWQFVTRSIRDKKIVFTDPELNRTETATSISCYSKQGLVWRLCLQLRITQLGNEKAREEALLLEAAVVRMLPDLGIKEALVSLKEYDENMPHTMTYGPAIFSTIKDQAVKLYESHSLKPVIARDFIEYTVRIGIVVQGAACSTYLARAKSVIPLKESSLQFNSLNAEIQKDPLLAQDIALGKRKVVMNDKGKAQVGSSWNKYSPYIMTTLFAVVSIWAVKNIIQRNTSSSLDFSPTKH